MTRAYVLGSYSTVFGRLPERTHKDLTREAVAGALADAGLEHGKDIDFVHFGSCAMGSWGQENIRGPVCLTPLVREGMLREGVPIVDVEGGCATGSMAFHGAWKDILSGECDLALALGVEKTFHARDAAKTRAVFEGGIDRIDPAEWQAYFERVAREIGRPFDPGAPVLFMETYALQAQWHMQRFGTTPRQLAAAAAKNHHNGALNPKAQIRLELSIDQVLADREIAAPLTRAMCAPISDGAAAALICSERWLERCPEPERARAIEIRASVLVSGRARRPDEPGLSREAARRAFARAGLEPNDVDVAEIHDATAWCELYQAEMLGFCEVGQGGPFVASGATALTGRIPLNPSGGLESKGHPLAATGLSQIDELTLQLRGEAGARQVPGARIGLQQNGGGLIGLDEAACSVILLERREPGSGA